MAVCEGARSTCRNKVNSPFYSSLYGGIYIPSHGAYAATCVEICDAAITKKNHKRKEEEGADVNRKKEERLRD